MRVIACLSLAVGLSAAPPVGAGELADAYRDEAGRILGAAMTDTRGWSKLEHLTTEIGPRLSGSRELEEAIDWAVAGMESEGLENVRRQPVKVPHWVRGEESLEVVSPSARRLAMLGLGLSVGTPREGITAPVVVVESWEQLDALPHEQVAGRIVVYAVPWEGYGTTVRYRGAGASRAAAKGAVAALVRSATGHSLYTPHTGALTYDEEQPRIPAAAITPEDAAWLLRMQERGRNVAVKLVMGARMLPDADSANVLAEIVGAERPEEIVVMGCHYDSWDVGQGAHDDGAACIAVWQALATLHDLELRPRRTLRAVLWTNEENGLKGALGYREAIGERIDSHVAAIEMDMGAERPIGLGLGLAGVDAEGGDPVYESAFAALSDLGSLLDGIGAGRIGRGGGGADIGPLMCDGVPGLMLQTVGERYFDWHHSAADTLDKVDPQDFRSAVALLAVAGYVLADMPDRLVPEGWRPAERPERCPPLSETAEAPRAEAVSLLGAELVPPAPSPEARTEQEVLLAEAEAAREADPGDVDAWIWVGRRQAYLGRYREAIATYSQALERFPDDARLHRHRGHRYLTVRELERAIEDLARGAELVAGRPDEVEPDGLPNERGIPTSTLHSNLWYHLGLAHYLRGDFEAALAAYRECLAVSANPDMLSATSYWLYLTLRRLDRGEEATAVLEPIHAGMDIIENGDYHRLLLAYKGELDPETLLTEAAADETGIGFPTVAYGVAAWHLVEGRSARAREILDRILASPSWAAFGYLAAEAETARERQAPGTPSSPPTTGR